MQQRSAATVGYHADLRYAAKPRHSAEMIDTGVEHDEGASLAALDVLDRCQQATSGADKMAPGFKGDCGRSRSPGRKRLVKHLFERLAQVRKVRPLARRSKWMPEAPAQIEHLAGQPSLHQTGRSLEHDIRGAKNGLRIRKIAAHIKLKSDDLHEIVGVEGVGFLQNPLRIGAELRGGAAHREPHTGYARFRIDTKQNFEARCHVRSSGANFDEIPGGIDRKSKATEPNGLPQFCFSFSRSSIETCSW